jgi:hypothetical protein
MTIISYLLETHNPPLLLRILNAHRHTPHSKRGCLLRCIVGGLLTKPSSTTLRAEIWFQVGNEHVTRFLERNFKAPCNKSIAHTPLESRLPCPLPWQQFFFWRPFSRPFRACIHTEITHEINTDRAEGQRKGTTPALQGFLGCAGAPTPKGPFANELAGYSAPRP